MADNTILNTGSGGDTIRDVAKTANSPAKTQVVILDVGGAADASSEVALVSTTKGVQGANPLPVQQIKDGGRTYVCLTAKNVAGTTTTTLVSLTINSGGSTSTATSYTVPVGNVLCIQAVAATWQATTTTASTTSLVSLLSAGSVATTSPALAVLALATAEATATTVLAMTADLSIPGGIYIAASQQVALSQVDSTTSGSLTITVIGYIF